MYCKKDDPSELNMKETDAVDREILKGMTKARIQACKDKIFKTDVLVIMPNVSNRVS